MKTALDPRHQKRQKIVQELFSWDAQNKINAPHTPPLEQLTDTTQKILGNLEQIDGFVSRNAPEREVSQINQIDLAILRLSIYEMVFDHKAPAKAIIDESVELAKEYGNESSPQFINGVLGNVFVDDERVRVVIADRLGVDSSKLTEETSLIEDLNSTELEIADLLALLEKEFHVIIPPATKCETVGDILNRIKEERE